MNSGTAGEERRMYKPPGTDPYQRFSTDITRFKHRGNEESVAAFNHCHAYFQKSKQAVWEVFMKAWPEPVTPKEVAMTLGKPLHAISGRCAELKQDGLLIPTGTVRDGSRALKVVLQDSGLALRHDLQPGEANPPQKLSPQERERIEDAIQDLTMKETLDLLLRENIRARVGGWEVII
jgi:hypothetical protein